MQSAPIDLMRVRRLFSKPENLTVADFINREIAARMLERLQLVRLDPKQIVDAGCGRGTDLSILHERYAGAQVIGVDASRELLQRADKEYVAARQSVRHLFLAWLFSLKKNNTANNQGALNKGTINLVSADFGQFPFAEQVADLVWSNLALHWHPEPDLVLKEWQRVLRVSGLLMFSCFGPDSLKEIRHAFADIDETPHALPFVDMHDFGDMLINAGFATPVMDMEVITLTYATVPQLLAEVRSLGGNPLQTRRKGLMGKAAWQQLCKNLELLRQEDGRIPLTLEVIYGHAFKPVAKRKNPTESVIKFDISKK